MVTRTIKISENAANNFELLKSRGVDIDLLVSDAIVAEFDRLQKQPDAAAAEAFLSDFDARHPLSSPPEWNSVNSTDRQAVSEYIQKQMIESGEVSADADRHERSSGDHRPSRSESKKAG